MPLKGCLKTYKLRKPSKIIDLPLIFKQNQWFPLISLSELCIRNPPQPTRLTRGLNVVLTNPVKTLNYLVQ